MVNTRGRVMWVKGWELETFRRQGAKSIMNPKQDYYPEYDQELNKSSVKGDILEQIDSDYLEVEEV